MISPCDMTGFFAKHVITLSLSSTEATIVEKLLVILPHLASFLFWSFSASLLLLYSNSSDWSIIFLPFFSNVITEAGLLTLVMHSIFIFESYWKKFDISAKITLFSI
jgi:hypothetical protein